MDCHRPFPLLRRYFPSKLGVNFLHQNQAENFFLFTLSNPAGTASDVASLHSKNKVCDRDGGSFFVIAFRHVGVYVDTHVVAGQHRQLAPHS